MPGTLTIEEANELVVEHQGWAESIARSVARSWNMDWRLDGLDGAAMEALIFCSRRFDPERGVPFKGYARKRVHEASTDAARKCKSWARGVGTSSAAQRRAREVSADLFSIFPELRSGALPFPEEVSGSVEGDTRAAIRHLLISANLLVARQGIASALPDEAMDYKKLIMILGEIEPIHQMIMWKVYWEGLSLRNVADNWDTDELNVIREHKVLLSYLQKSISKGNSKPIPKLRPGLRKVAVKLKKEKLETPFADIIQRGEDSWQKK